MAFIPGNSDAMWLANAVASNHIVQHVTAAIKSLAFVSEVSGTEQNNRKNK